MADGVREQKKRETRQRISDTATEMFMAYGFDNVTVAEVAAAAEVSEKTVYNYFPTKESLVFDTVDEQLERLTGAVRDREPSVAVTSAFVAALKADTARFAEAIGPERLSQISDFAAMVRGTPSLRAALSDYRHRLVAALSEVLADELQVDPADPEPMVGARALVGLAELLYDAQLRHSRDASDPARFFADVSADIDRGARLLDTGIWSLHAVVAGRRTSAQVRAAANRAEQARRQVLSALREAKREWQAACEAGHEAHRAARHGHTQAHAQSAAEARAAREQARDAIREAHAQAHAAAREAREQAHAAAREAREQARNAAREAREKARDAARQARNGGAV